MNTPWIIELGEEGMEQYLQEQLNKSQARCDRFRNILIEIGYVKLENLEEFLAEGKLTPNDVRYLYGLDEIGECGKDIIQGFEDGMKDGSFAINVVKEDADEDNI